MDWKSTQQQTHHRVLKKRTTQSHGRPQCVLKKRVGFLQTFITFRQKAQRKSSMAQQGANQCSASLVFPPNIPTDADKKMIKVWEVAQGANRIVDSSDSNGYLAANSVYHRLQQRLAPELRAHNLWVHRPFASAFMTQSVSEDTYMQIKKMNETVVNIGSQRWRGPKSARWLSSQFNFSRMLVCQSVNRTVALHHMKAIGKSNQVLADCSCICLHENKKDRWYSQVDYPERQCSTNMIKPCADLSTTRWLIQYRHSRKLSRPSIVAKDLTVNIDRNDADDWSALLISFWNRKAKSPAKSGFLLISFIDSHDQPVL